ncbi:serine hydrolase domain-containing protein, partial [Arthrospira platensis SPKY1]|nr:serine hydrolase domain-containing protein [Arthrospira platensis SPKY1]
MLANMAAQLDGNVVGYQIAVSIDGLVRATRSYGLSKRSPDCEVGMFDCRKFNIASQTKTITVAAVLKLLEENGLTIDSPVSPHLPDDWTRTSYMD